MQQVIALKPVACIVYYAWYYWGAPVIGDVL